MLAHTNKIDAQAQTHIDTLDTCAPLHAHTHAPTHARAHTHEYLFLPDDGRVHQPTSVMSCLRFALIIGGMLESFPSGFLGLIPSANVPIHFAVSRSLSCCLMAWELMPLRCVQCRSTRGVGCLRS